MKVTTQDSAVSEIIGIVLLFGLTITLFSVLYLSMNPTISESSVISTNIVAYIENGNIILEHHGGESLSSDSTVEFVIGDTQVRTDVVDIYLSDSNGNNKWDIGEKIQYSTSLDGLQVETKVINQPSNTLLFKALLQEGGIGTPQFDEISTFINHIIPYEISSSPIQLTANSTQGPPDNVSLYYRWSKYNWSIGTTVLHYDDFESGWGNYTSGGSDSTLYTDRVYSHQGDNAAHIKNNGNDASFYLTNPIDIDSLENTMITIDFWFSKDSGPGAPGQFTIDYYDGSDWQTITTYMMNQYSDGEFYHKQVLINESSYAYPSNANIRFKGDMPSRNMDHVYFDQIYINATIGDAETIFTTSFEEPSELINWDLDIDRTTAGSGYTLELEDEGPIGPRTGDYYLGGTGDFDPNFAAYNRTIDITQYENVSVSVWYSFEDTEDVDEFGFYYWDGSDWTEIFEDLSPNAGGQETWTNVMVEIDDSINDLILQFRWSTSSSNEHVMIDDLTVTGDIKNTGNWLLWDDSSNPDTSSPWKWSFHFPDAAGYYEFYSIGKSSTLPDESAPSSADAICHYDPDNP